MEPIRYFAIRNFDKFQHYTDRNPPWIKLYRSLWDDRRFFQLSETDRYILIGLFVLASQNQNQIPVDQEWIKAKLLTRLDIPIEKLAADGWIDFCVQDASKMLQSDASTRALARGEKSREEEYIVDKSTISGSDGVIVKNGNPPVERKPEKPTFAYPEEFLLLWNFYPPRNGSREGKGAALKAWQRARKNGMPDTDRLLAVIERAKQTTKWLEENGKFIPMLSTFLNQHRWDDDYEPRTRKARGVVC